MSGRFSAKPLHFPFKRLTEIKSKYDPANLFHVNQNIKPAAKS